MEDLIKYYSNKKLLANGSSNTKLAKNTVKTYGLSLIPHSLNTKGVNLCKFSTKECRSLCLNKSVFVAVPVGGSGVFVAVFGTSVLVAVGNVAPGA